MTSADRRLDAIIVGAGMAGAACASRLLDAGMRCLVLEAGPSEDVAPPARTFVQKVRGKLDPRHVPPRAGRWPGAISLSEDGKTFHPAAAVLGTGPGGGSRVYGAALARFEPDDFAVDRDPVQWGGEPIPNLLPNRWPLAPDAMDQWYVAAETALIGASPRSVDHLENRPLPPISPRDAFIMEATSRAGLHPERLQVGIDYRPGCNECQGVVCTRPCRRNAWTIFTKNHSAPQVRLETDCKVSSITRSADQYHVHCRIGGSDRVFTASTVILAAGALNSPLVLHRSGNLWPDGIVPEMVGRGLMFHVSDIFLLTTPVTVPAFGARKTIRIADFLEREGVPYGEIQSLAVDPSIGLTVEYLRNLVRGMGFERFAIMAEAARLAEPFLAAQLADASMFATIIEDLPIYDNRVCESATVPGEISITYRIPPELAERSNRLRKMIVDQLAELRPRFISRSAVANLGHPMGTCRMGDDPAMSVVDRDGQVWGQPGLYVCDAAVLPSSGRTNPALTVTANALRIGDAIVRSVQSRDRRARPAEEITPLSDRAAVESA
jgi:choline dehydrogenase-like flavoprotein